MTTIEEQKQKLEQKKARMVLEEAKLKIKEEKMRTKSLIEKGSLITKADLDYLPNNLLFLKKQIKDNENIIAKWIVEGNQQLNLEKKDTKAVILKFEEEPNNDVREFIRSHGLRFNRFRKEWYGNTSRLAELKNSLGKIKYELTIIEE